MRREFDDYFNEALEKGWWQGVALPLEDKPPRVMIEVGGNLLRRTRGGETMFLRTSGRSSRSIVSVDVRMSTTGLFSDYVLPAAQQYERPHAIGFAGQPVLPLLDKAVEPAGEALPEWQIFRRCRASSPSAARRAASPSTGTRRQQLQPGQPGGRLHR